MCGRPAAISRPEEADVARSLQSRRLIRSVPRAQLADVGKVMGISSGVGCLVAALALAGCGEIPGGAGDAKPEAANGSGLTIDLPEPVADEVEKDAADSAVAKPVPPPATNKAPSIPAGAQPAPEAPPERKAPAPSDPRQAEVPERAPGQAAAAPAAGTSGPPLPNSVIARTLDRIGFRCGSVVSTDRVDALDGGSAYKVTCSSGQSYRASDQTGRYRFSKWSGGE